MVRMIVSLSKITIYFVRFSEEVNASEARFVAWLIYKAVAVGHVKDLSRGNLV